MIDSRRKERDSVNRSIEPTRSDINGSIDLYKPISVSQRFMLDNSRLQWRLSMSASVHALSCKLHRDGKPKLMNHELIFDVYAPTSVLCSEYAGVNFDLDFDLSQWTLSLLASHDSQIIFTTLAMVCHFDWRHYFGLVIRRGRFAATSP